MIARSPSSWWSVSNGNASVMLLTDPEFGVSAQALESGEPGSVGAPGDLRFELVPNAKQVRKGEHIITAGTCTSSRVIVEVLTQPNHDVRVRLQP